MTLNTKKKLLKRFYRRGFEYIIYNEEIKQNKNLTIYTIINN